MTEGYGVATNETGMLYWTEVQNQLVAARNYWVATTRPNGRPHVMPVWGLWWNEAVYFSSDSQSRKARNLVMNPEVVVHLESGDDAVILEGAVERVTDVAELTEFADRYDTKYAFRPDINNPDFAFYRLRPRVAFAWREADFPNTATRWRLNQD
jgi:general stress protein 26